MEKVTTKLVSNFDWHSGYFPNDILRNRSLCTTVFFETSQVVLEGLQFPSGKYANGLVYFVENPWEV